MPPGPTHNGKATDQRLLMAFLRVRQGLENQYRAGLLLLGGLIACSAVGVADEGSHGLLESEDREKVIAKLEESAAHDSVDWKRRARAHGALGQSLEAAADWQRAAKLDASDQEAFRGWVFALSDLKAFTRASEVAHRHWDWFDENEQKRLSGDLAAATVRWMDLSLGPGERTEMVSDRAESALALALGKPWSALKGDDPQDARIGQDRLLALAKAHRNAEAIAWAHDLERAGVTLEPYAQAALAAALAEREHSRAAARQFDPAVKALPWDIETGMGYFYALGDAGRYGAARDHLEGHRERQAFWAGNFYLGETTANQPRIEADVAKGLLRSWSGDPAEARVWLGEFSETAPSSSDLHVGLAEVALETGQPRAALREARWATGLEPQSASGQALVLQSRLETGDWDGIDNSFQHLTAEFPYDADVRSAWSQWRWETAPEVDWEVKHGRSDGVESPGRETIVRGRIRSSAFGPNRRLSTAVVETSELAKFPEGDAEEHRLGMAFRAVTGEQVWQFDGGAVDQGGFYGNLGWEWRPSDALEWNVQGELDSLEAPLRGRRAGVQADRLSLGGGWSWFEKGGLTWSVSRLAFNDSNLRREIGLDGVYRLWHGGGLESFAGAGLHASWSREVPEAVYFNPSADFSPEAMLTLRHRLRGNVTHEATAFGGVYAQEGFSNLGYGGVRYEMEWEILQRARLFLGGEWLTHPYDGARENSTEGQVGLKWRF
jgi:biofilm PGA synthesis protein PgaA